MIKLLRAILGAFPWLLSMFRGNQLTRERNKVRRLEGQLAKEKATNAVDDLTDEEVADRLRKWQE